MHGYGPRGESSSDRMAREFREKKKRTRHLDPEATEQLGTIARSLESIADSLRTIAKVLEQKEAP